MAAHVILISVDEPFAASVDSGRLERLARRVLESEGADACELSVAVTDDETVRRLNRDYAGEDAVTDVLSFSQTEGEEFVGAPGAIPPLGEVVISYPQAARQAGERRWGADEGEALREPRGERTWEADRGARPSTGSGQAATGGAKDERSWGVQREMERLLVHGVLHLLGYDHAEVEEEKVMREREDRLLAGAG